MISLAGMLDAVTDYFSSLSPGWLYFAVFLSSYVENIFPPIPGDTVTVFAAYLVGRSQKHFMGIFCATTLGSVAGFMTYYVLGRMLQPDYFLRKSFRFLPASSFQKAGDWVKRYGYWIVLSNRFLSGIRSVISIVSGFYRLPWIQVLILASVSCAVWNGLLIWAGYLLGANWRNIDHILQQYQRVLLTALALVAGFWILRKLRSRRPPA